MSRATVNRLSDMRTQQAGRHEEERTLFTGDVCLSDCWHHLGCDRDDRHCRFGEAAGTPAEGIILLHGTLIA